MHNSLKANLESQVKLAAVLPNAQKEKDLTSYLKTLKLNGVNPNFWCSEEYFKKAGWTEDSSNGFIRVRDNEGALMLPPVGVFSIGFEYPVEEVWSDFLDYHHPNAVKEFLDFEYIFDSNHFKTMSGGNWSVFRKNCRKWPNRIGAEWSYRPVPRDYPTDALDNLLVSWLGGLNVEEQVHDSDVLISYVRNGENRMGLFTDDGEIHALNIWDSNYKYINHRYCICKAEPFLSEFTRYLFYDDINSRGGALVNDGGVLDRLSLKTFKDHMNPISIRKVHSWRPE